MDTLAGIHASVAADTARLVALQTADEHSRAALALDIHNRLRTAESLLEVLRAAGSSSEAQPLVYNSGASTRIISNSNLAATTTSTPPPTTTATTATAATTTTTFSTSNNTAAAAAAIATATTTGSATGSRPHSSSSDALHDIQQELALDRIAYRRAQIVSREATRNCQRAALLLSLHPSSLNSASVSASASASDTAGPSSNNVNTTSPSSSSSSRPPPVGHSRALETAQNATASLRRTHALLETEIARSSFSLDSLDQSTAQLKSLSTRYSTVDSLLGASRAVISVLEQADKWDRIYMLASLGFLVLVLIYVLYRRVFKGPLRLLLATTLYSTRAVKWLFVGTATTNTSSTASSTSSTTTTSTASLLELSQTLASLVTTLSEHDEL
ncbi:Sec20-domain-containing protein [Lipomyces oligophaga]|uniref:Sec20-domain-containing protein n=1 Tax=Lipomyces oligophaga TaxID=45792 RepID=UPI0034CD7A0F